MAKPRGAICNLECRYCYYLHKKDLYPESSFYMPDEVLETFIRQYIRSQPAPVNTFYWQGGEPLLMGLDFFQRAVEIQEKHRKPGMVIQNCLQTNGTLLDEDWGKFLHQHRFLIGLSLDGPAEMHNAYRVDKGGRPTFDRVVKGLEVLKRHHVAFNVLTCVHSANVNHPLEVYRFIRDEVGCQHIQFIPIVEIQRGTHQGSELKVTEHTVGSIDYGKFLMAIFDEWVRHDVGKIFIQTFEATLGAWYSRTPGLCIFEKTCGQVPVLEHNGDLFSCDHFVTPEHFLGNILTDEIDDLVRSTKQRQFGRNKQDTLPKYCRNCSVRFVCNGGCSKDRFAITPDGEAGLNYLCEGYKLFFQYTTPYMKVMTDLLHQRKPPSKVMDMLPMG